MFLYTQGPLQVSKSLQSRLFSTPTAATFVTALSKLFRASFFCVPPLAIQRPLVSYASSLALTGQERHSSRLRLCHVVASALAVVHIARVPYDVIPRDAPKMLFLDQRNSSSHLFRITVYQPVRTGQLRFTPSSSTSGASSVFINLTSALWTQSSTSTSALPLKTLSHTQRANGARRTTSKNSFTGVSRSTMQHILLSDAQALWLPNPCLWPKRTKTPAFALTCGVSILSHARNVGP